MAGNVHEVTDENFEQEVLQADQPVILDMWAPWCGPCRMVGPIIEQIAEDNDGRIKVCKMNVDENQSTAGDYGITAIPSVLFFKDGEEKQNLRMVGAQGKAAYQQAVDKLKEA